MLSRLLLPCRAVVDLDGRNCRDGWKAGKAAGSRPRRLRAINPKGVILWPVPDLRAFLCGEWAIDRSLLDRRHSVTGTFRGLGHYTPAGTSLLYEERGALDFGAHHGSAEQRYRYDFEATDERAIVRFRDGRTFHEMDLATGETVIAHACGADLYKGRIVAIGPTRWASAWTVAGPRKDQEIRSLYTRVA